MVVTAQERRARRAPERNSALFFVSRRELPLCSSGGGSGSGGGSISLVSVIQGRAVRTEQPQPQRQWITGVAVRVPIRTRLLMHAEQSQSKKQLSRSESENPMFVRPRHQQQLLYCVAGGAHCRAGVPLFQYMKTLHSPSLL